MSLWRSAACCAWAIAVCGCSLDSYGLVASDVSRAHGALIVDVYSIGANFRTRGDDPGLSLGAAKRSYVFPISSGGRLAPGWHYFWASLPARPSLVQHADTIGIELRADSPGPSFDLGYSETTILARLDADSAIDMQLTYRPAAPALTQLRYCEGKVPC